MKKRVRTADVEQSRLLFLSRELRHVDVFEKHRGLELLLYERLIHQFSREVEVLFGAGVGLFFEIGSGCVATFDDLVVEEGFVEFF